MRRSMLVVPALALVAALGFVTPPASADGGTYPSNAPTIASGYTVTGGAASIQSDDPNDAGKAGVQYYKVNMAFADHLVVDLTHITGNSGSDVCVMAPTVTDYTVADAGCLESAYTPTSKKVELQYIAPGNGAYLLVVTPSCCSGGSWAYSMIVNVLHYSTVSAIGPPGVKVGHKIKVRGQASTAGALSLQLKAGGWQTVATGNTKSDGTFKLGYKATHTGSYKFRVLFASSGYIGSKSSKVKVRVHR